MEPLWWIAGVGALLALSAVASLRGVASTERQQRAVLPSHYDAWNYIPERSGMPGWCPHCDIENDPGYDFCRECAEKLPAHAQIEERPIERLGS